MLENLNLIETIISSENSSIQNIKKSHLKRKIDKKFLLRQIDVMKTRRNSPNQNSIDIEYHINNKNKDNNNDTVDMRSQFQSQCDDNSRNENKFRKEILPNAEIFQTRFVTMPKQVETTDIIDIGIKERKQNDKFNKKRNRILTDEITTSRRWAIKHLLTILVIFVYNTMNLCNAISTSQLGMKTEPIFLSTSAAFKFVVGQTIQLPCEVRTPGQYILAWKRGIAILTAGSVRVSPDPRISLVNGNTLQIRDATPADAGDYICQIATLEPKEIIHHVEILIPPKIHHVTNGGLIQVKKGSPVRLECSAQGNPTPNITWTRKNNILPNGEDRYVSNVYIIENMDRHKGGTYTCTANNGVGQPASSQIILHVLYPPEITVEKTVVYSGEGQEAVLVCIVHGESQPEVTWLKDTMQIDTTERHIMESRGARHSLIIRKVYSTDFGNYTCQADNQLGKARKTISLTGKPNIPSFRSGPISQWKDRYNISWIVNSFAPIEEYKLFYRPTQNAIENTFDGGHNAVASAPGFGNPPNRNYPYLKRNDDDPLNPSFMDSMLFHSGYSSTGMHWSRYEWREIILQAMSGTSRYTQGMNYILRGLEPDQQYEAKLQARNRFGWSDFSDIFLFTTSNTDTEMRDLSVTHYSSTSSSSSIFPWSSFSSTASTIMFSHHSIINYSVIVLICISFLFL
ncbi:neural cell adhesion molecule 2-like [Condylostylus longicornis]|uniref:neural cell adhesion molecule 2-like n=1 Tax=Condylostylus longicornis TaxID=2530218 RepID=UPI00244E27CA|nr:neural cell adhesion molecule 2-like [Condylostylus longicornis]